MITLLAATLAYEPIPVLGSVFAWLVLLLLCFYAGVFLVTVRLLWHYQASTAALPIWHYRGAVVFLLVLSAVCASGAYALGQHMALFS